MAKLIIAPAPPKKPVDLGQGVKTGRRKMSSRQQGASRYGRMNNWVGYFLLGLVLISAVPVASNRPSWWLLWTMILGGVGIFYVLRAQYLMGQRREFQSSQYHVFFALALLVPIYALIQSLPFADFLPAALQSLPSHVPSAIMPHSISVMPDASVIGALRAFGFILFVILTLEVGTKADRNHALGFWLMIGILVHGLFGMISLKFFDDFSLWGIKESYQQVLTGTFVNRNSIATFLGFGLILGVAYALDRGIKAASVQKDRGYQTLFTPARIEIMSIWMAVIVLAFAVVLTQSRMGVFATAVGAYVTFLTSRLVVKAPLAKVVFESVVGVVVFLLFLIPATGAGVIERALFVLVESTDRFAIYAQTWDMIQDRPFTGFGYDAFAPAFELYRAPPLVTENYIDLAHNSYLALWSEQGILIGSIPMVLMGWSFWMIVQRLHAQEGDRAVNMAGLGVIVLGAVHSMADFSLEIPANTYCFLFIVGLAISRPRLSQPIPREKVDVA